MGKAQNYTHWVFTVIDGNNFVVPAEAGTQRLCFERRWIPAFAGMTGSFRPPSLIYSKLNNVMHATIRQAVTSGDIELARALFVEYAQWLKVDLCFQGFDQELKTLPGAYAPPRGRLLIAGTPEAAFGCIALRPLDAGPPCGCGKPATKPACETPFAEVKRLYVHPTHRGGHWGQRLAAALIAEARAIGYRELKLDTLDWMKPARALYAGLGFRECEPYYNNPLPGAVYMSLSL